MNHIVDVVAIQTLNRHVDIVFPDKQDYDSIQKFENILVWIQFWQAKTIVFVFILTNVKSFMSVACVDSNLMSG